ncbi:sodium:solute symporter family protein [Ectothiorhodospira mobilis]|uniref:sodium:solute symporter family protein n=1 Tax=Ectothiorhodospira mobilis TaxID=195064 RepID=UPI001EE95BF1|nr:sodium:solute symporter family protein [Ectothiorhodospira mobilis]MCG5535427.1 cation acetate symporter [Ectothiorhodospira mobilis]
MDLKLMIYLVVGATFALYIGIAIWARAGSTGEFYVAGKGVNPVANGMATAADWMSAASFISMAGLIAFLGYSGSVYLMGWTGGYVLMALLLAPYLRKFGKFTVPQFVGDRFYSNTARIVAVICLLVISITYVIGQMRGVGIAFSRFLEVDLLWGLIAGMGVVFVYAVLGGMKGITYTQIAQYVVMIFAYTVPAIFISLQLTGHFLPQTGLGGTLSGQDGMYLLNALDQTLVDLGFNEYTTNRNLSTLNIFLLTMALMIGTAGLPHVIIRFFTVPRVRDARKSAGWALVFIAILYTTAPAVGAMAMYNLIDTFHPGGVGNPEAAMVYEDRPQWMRTWEETGLLQFEQEGDGERVHYYNYKNPPAWTEEAELDGYTVANLDRDIMVLANPEIASLPNWVIALVAAGGIAAALSTAAGLLLAISSAISHDLLKGVFMPKISEKNELMAGRLAMVAAILLAGYLGLNPPGFAAEVVALAFGLAASSLFPVLMMGIFYKRMNRQGAIAGMLVGISTTLIYIFLYKGWFFFPGTAMLADNPDGWLLGIAPQGFGTVGAIFNVITAFVVSKLTAPPPKEIQDLVESVRVPRADTA